MTYIKSGSVFQGRLPNMVQPFRLRRITRRRLVWLVTLLLLWQQVALAAYACQAVAEPMGQVTAMMSTASTSAMDDGCADMRDTPASPLCQQHCTPDHATQVDARPMSVPLSALTAVPPMLMSVASIVLSSDRALTRHELRQTPPSIPRLLFCSLLI
ncbi:MAG: hypothetical protein ABIU96_07660 [Rhodanobacter sp.]